MTRYFTIAALIGATYFFFHKQPIPPAHDTPAIAAVAATTARMPCVRVAWVPVIWWCWTGCCRGAMD